MDFASAIVRPLIVGVAIYVGMRFLVAHSLDNGTRSLIAGTLAFVLAIAVLRIRYDRAL